jgi:hypothetical protein
MCASAVAVIADKLRFMKDVGGHIAMVRHDCELSISLSVGKPSRYEEIQVVDWHSLRWLCTP